MIKLFDIHIRQGEDILIENTGKGDLLISPMKSGSFSGQRIKGRVLPLGMCTTYTPSDGINLIHAPILLETDDCAKLFMELNAYLHLAGELEDQLLAGEHVSPDQYYYRGTVSFDVGRSQYKWLENRVFTCEGIIRDWSRLEFMVYEV